MPDLQLTSLKLQPKITNRDGGYQREALELGVFSPDGHVPSPKALLEFVRATVRKHNFNPDGQGKLEGPIPVGICSMRFVLTFHDSLSAKAQPEVAVSSKNAINRALAAMERAHDYLQGDAAIIEDLGQSMVALQHLRIEIAEYQRAVDREERTTDGQDYEMIMDLLDRDALLAQTPNPFASSEAPALSPGM